MPMSNQQWFNQAAGRVLLISNGLSGADWIDATLQAAGHTVLRASDGEQGMPQVSGGVDLILLDMHLPPPQVSVLWQRVHASSTDGYPPIVLLCRQQKGNGEQGWPAGAAGLAKDWRDSFAG